MQNIIIRFYYLLFIFFISLQLAARDTPFHLTCEYKENPAGIEVQQPRFGWWIHSKKMEMKQTAYEIVLASSLKNLYSTKAATWKSGKISSGDNFSVFYNGPKLQAASLYYWKVRTWDQKGMVSDWSKPASFITGLFEEKNWRNSKWISYDILPSSEKVVPAAHGSGDGLGEKLLKRTVVPYFRKTFQTRKAVDNAFVFVSGLGQYELYVNGKKIGNDFLAPAWSDYEKAIFYNTYEVTNEIRTGDNAIGSIAGPGFFYINRERYRKITGAYGYPMFRMILMIRYKDGTTEEVVTDDSWRTSASPIVFSGFYGGEDYDARLEQPNWCNVSFNDASWAGVKLPQPPPGILKAEPAYPVKIMDSFVGGLKSSLPGGKQIVDFGQNASGIIRLKVSGNRGDRVRITPSEMPDKNGQISQRSSGGPFYFEYILKGEGVEEWQPRFTYYGFRYALVEGAAFRNGNKTGGPRLISIDLLHTRNSAPAVGSFSCSSELFNKTFDLINWAIKSNISSVSTDCPHREKLGWIEQAHLMGPAAHYNFDIAAFYTKIVKDLQDAQLPNGMVPSIAPEYVEFDGPFRNDPGYGVAATVLPFDVFRWYGDKKTLEEAYPMMKKYVDYLQSQSKSNILDYGLGDWLDLGNASPGFAQLTPVSLTATAFYFQAVQIMAETAGILNRTTDAGFYRKLAEQIKSSFNRSFYNPATHTYGTGSQTSYAMPLFFDLVEEGKEQFVVKNLSDSLKKYNYKVTAGDIGHRFLIQALTKTGQSELIYKIHHRDDMPGYGFQIKSGATALAEHWSGPAVDWLSQNHMIFGHLMEWFYNGLAGIKQQTGSIGYRKLLIEPQFLENISWVKTTFNSVNGPVSVHYNKNDRATVLNVGIPPNCDAIVVLPNVTSGEVFVNSRLLNLQKQPVSSEIKNGKLYLHLAAGNYKIDLNRRTF